MIVANLTLNDGYSDISPFLSLEKTGNIRMIPIYSVETLHLDVY